MGARKKPAPVAASRVYRRTLNRPAASAGARTASLSVGCVATWNGRRWLLAWKIERSED